MECPCDGNRYQRGAGIWRFLTADRVAYFETFRREYETVRRTEGWGAPDEAYYRALPFEDRTGCLSQLWHVRAQNFQACLERVIQPIERLKKPLHILDVGAGNGWLSYRLAQRGHRVAAIDVLINASDGLGAYIHYDAAFTPVQAEFDRLPFDGDQIDVLIFNGSVHYSIDYEQTMCEALRVMRDDGRLVILDSPVYQHADSGRQMVREREARFERSYGFRSNALPSENYLTYQRLRELELAFKVQWDILGVFHGWRWMLQRWKAQLHQRREAANFPVIVGRRTT